MSGPGGRVTKRDERRDARRSQLQQRQLARQRERAAKIRRQRITQATLVVGTIVILALVAFLVIRGVSASSGPQNSGSLAPASGQTVDGMPCMTNEGSTLHVHAYVKLYVDGKEQVVPPGIGVVAPPSAGVSALGSNGAKSCLYPLHVHDQEPNIIHVESPTKTDYTLGQLFDLWGQQLSATQVMDQKVGASRPLTVQVIDSTGKVTQETGDPRKIVMHARDTIVILYNSANVKPAPFTDWNGL